MMKEKQMHLNEDEILLSQVDEKDLPEERKSHLLDCPLCQKKRVSLTSELDLFGKMAREYAPLPHKKIKLPLSKPRLFNFRLQAFAAGFLLLVLIVYLWSPPFFMDSSNQITDRLSTEMEVNLDLTDDILGESPLPRDYLNIIIASYGYFDNEFLEFIVPIEGQFNSSIEPPVQII